MTNAQVKAVAESPSRPGWPGPAGWAGIAGAALAGAYLFNRWSTTVSENETPPPGSFVDAGGVRLHYVDRGKGSPIVLIHGNGSLVQDFTVSGLVDALAKDYRVIAFDRPGYGYSERPRDREWTPEAQAAVFVAACAELGIHRPLVVGHSWGTLPAIAWALDYPDDVAGIALLSGYYFGSPRVDAVLAGLGAVPVIGDVLSNTILPLQTRVSGPLGLKMIFSPDAVPDRVMDELPFGLMLRPSQLHATAADSGQMPVAAARLSERYDALTLPMAIIWGDGDKLVPGQGQSARLANERPAADAVMITDAGHMVHHTHLDRVEHTIRSLASQALA